MWIYDKQQNHCQLIPPNYHHTTKLFAPVATNAPNCHNIYNCKQSTDGRTDGQQQIAARTTTDYKNDSLWLKAPLPKKKIVCYQGIKKSHTRTSWRLGASNYVDREYVTLGGFLIYMDSLLNHPISVIHSGIHSFDCLVHQPTRFIRLSRKNLLPVPWNLTPFSKMWSLLERM